jgi:putative MATE family efflux protein
VPQKPDGRPPPAAPSPLLTAPILPTLLRLSVPNIVAMLATALVAIAETAYVGRLGLSELAGIALVFPFVMLQQMMSAGAMGGGVSSAISRALGAGDVARAETLVRHALLIGATAGAAFTILFLTIGPALYRLLGGTGAALQQAILYSNIVFLGSVAVWLTNTLASVLRGTGNMQVPSLVLLTIAALQIVLGGVLGLGLGPIRSLGMAGIALGQVLAFGIGALILAGYLAAGRARVRLTLAGPLLGAMFRDILKVGAVACISPAQSVLTVLVVTGFVATFGPEALAGYGIGARLEFLLVPISFAIGVATVPMVGMAIGAGDVGRARRVAWTGGALAAVLVGSLGLLVAIAPGLWSRLFTDNAGVLDVSASYFAQAGPAYAFFGLGMVLYFASMGSGRIFGPVLAQTVRLLVVAAGGWWLTHRGGSATELFQVVGAAFLAYGLAASLAVWRTRWTPAGTP